MADHYVSHLGDGTAPTAGMATAHQTQEAARAAAVAGDRILVAHDHNDPLLAATSDYVYASTGISPISIEVVDRLTLAKAVGTGFNFRTDSGFNLTLRGTTNVGALSIDGLNIVIGGGTATTGQGALILGTAFQRTIANNLTVDLPNGTGACVQSSAGVCEFNNIKIKGANTNVGIRALSSDIFVRNSAPFADSPVLPLNLLFLNNANRIVWDHCDLSLLGSCRFYLGPMTTGTNTRVSLIACHINSACGILNGDLWLNRVNFLEMRDCIDEAGRIHNEFHNASGSFTCDYNVYRTGGAQDVNGNPFSARLVTSALARKKTPVETFELNFEVPLAKVGVSTTVTLHIIYDAAAANLDTLLTTDIWAEGMVRLASRPRTLTAVNVVNSVDAGVALASSGEAWSGTGGMTTPTKRVLTFTFIPDSATLHKFRVRLAKASIASGVYVCLSPQTT